MTGALLSAIGVLALLSLPPEAVPPPAGPAASSAIDDGAGNCRLWGLAAITIPPGLLEDHLISGAVTSFQELGAGEDDGWGFASFPRGALGEGLAAPLERRGRVPADHPHDTEFAAAVDELVALQPGSIIGHLRNASSGHRGIPDPHPFIRGGYAFAHNGSASVSSLLELLYIDDPDYLVTHPPDYVQEYIDSELYFLWILKYAENHPGLPFGESLREAVELLRPHVGNARLNCVVSRGDTLWAVRSAVNDAADALRYFPMSTPTPSCWVVASEIVGSDSTAWGTFPMHCVGVFVPRQPPEFLLLDLRGEGHPKPGERDPDPEIPVHDPRSSVDRPVTAFPNPSAGAVTIAWPARSALQPVSWEIWDAHGRRLRSEAARLPRVDATGAATITWDGRDQEGRAAPAGIYFCRIRDGEMRLNRRITLLH